MSFPLRRTFFQTTDEIIWKGARGQEENLFSLYLPLYLFFHIQMLPKYAYFWGIDWGTIVRCPLYRERWKWHFLVSPHFSSISPFFLYKSILGTQKLLLALVSVTTTTGICSEWTGRIEKQICFNLLEKYFPVDSTMLPVLLAPKHIKWLMKVPSGTWFFPGSKQKDYTFNTILLPDRRQQVGLTGSPLSTLNGSQGTQGLWFCMGSDMYTATVRACQRQSQEPLIEPESLVITQKENNKAPFPATLTAVVFCTRSHLMLLSPVIC